MMRSLASRVITGPISFSSLRPGPYICSLGPEDIDELVSSAPDRDGGRYGHTAFSCRAEGGRHDVVGGEVDVSVGEDHGVVLGATECLGPFAGRGRPEWT